MPDGVHVYGGDQWARCQARRDGGARCGTRLRQVGEGWRCRVVVLQERPTQALGEIIVCPTCNTLHELMFWAGGPLADREQPSDPIAEDWKRRWKRGLTTADEEELLETVRQAPEYHTNEQLDAARASAAGRARVSLDADGQVIIFTPSTTT